MATLIINAFKAKPLSSLPVKVAPSPLGEKVSQVGKENIPPIADLKPAPSAETVFWALGDDWWKQILDARYHKYGPMVFDRGLHGYAIEPGYYDGVHAACKLASHPRALMHCPTVQFYKMLHKSACRHFDGESTLIDASEVGHFSASIDGSCSGSNAEFYLLSPNLQEVCKNFAKFSKYRKHAKEIEDYKAHLKDPTAKSEKEQALKEHFPDLTPDQVLKEYAEAQLWLKTFDAEIRKKIDKINIYITEKSLALGLSHPIAILKFDGDHTKVEYQCSFEEVEVTAWKLFAEYNKNMAKAVSKEEKLALIANLFQMLEWLHPFVDGQGRTDLILLTKELCRHGFTPAILDQPYFSTFATLSEWVAYLKLGMERWQKEADKKPSDKAIKV